MYTLRQTLSITNSYRIDGLKITSNVRKSSSSFIRSQFLETKQPSKHRGHLQIIATSEHWWEDEDEFDALTDALRQKNLVVAIHDKCIGSDQLKAYIQNLDFVAGFCGSQEIDFATAVWSGRDCPPLFLKMRRRVSLDASDRAADFLAETLEQNWRMDLDAGLGVEEPPAENILVVCSAEVAQGIVQACGSSTENDIAVIVLAVGGTHAGDPAEWQTLQKSVVLGVDILPENGETLKI